MIVRENYRISESTMALKEALTPEYNVEIHDVDGIFYSTKTPRELLDEACMDRFNTYNGRIEAARKILFYPKKTPLVFGHHDHLSAFPTKSPDAYDCIWIFPKHIKTHVIKGKDLYVLFQNGQMLKLNCSLYTFQRQRERTANCLMKISDTAFIQVIVKKS